MKKSPYMASAEMSQIIWCSAILQMIEQMLKTTKEKEWVKRFKTVETLINKTVVERLVALEQVERDKVERRAKNLATKVYSYDDARVDRSDHNRKVTVVFEDLLDIADLALLECKSCPQGDVVKNCRYRQAYHKLGLTCGSSRENPKDGECEFRFDNVQVHVTPQYKRIDGEVIEQLP